GGTGAQKVTRRKTSTEPSAAAGSAPVLVSAATRAASTAPIPPGVGAAEAMVLAVMNNRADSGGDNEIPNAAHARWKAAIEVSFMMAAPPRRATTFDGWVVWASITWTVRQNGRGTVTAPTSVQAPAR